MNYLRNFLHFHLICFWGHFTPNHTVLEITCIWVWIYSVSLQRCDFKHFLLREFKIEYIEVFPDSLAHALLIFIDSSGVDMGVACNNGRFYCFNAGSAIRCENAIVVENTSPIFRTLHILQQKQCWWSIWKNCSSGFLKARAQAAGWHSYPSKRAG